MSVYSSSDTQWSLTNSTFNKEHEVHTASEWLKVVVQTEFHIHTFLCNPATNMVFKVHLNSQQ